MTRPEIDTPIAIRDGEEIDLPALMVYLQIALDREITNLTAQQFPGGFSNLTYLIAVDDHEYVLRRPPFGPKARSAHDMGREFRILSALSPTHDWAPAPLVLCDDPAIIGAPFYLMERVKGFIFRSHVLPEIDPDPGKTTAAAHALVDTLIDIHRVDLGPIGLADFGKPDGYVTRQVEGWSDRYQRARTNDIAEMGSVSDWLLAHQPAEAPGTLIHNDFKYDNLVYDPDDFSRVRAVLDWEMATVGDPLMDLGLALGYWTDPGDAPEMVEMRLSPTTLAGNPARADIAQRYALATGSGLDEVVFYYVFGLFKIAVIVQQICYRYQRGDTTDPRFASLMDVVRGCARMAWQSIQLGRIDRLFQE